MEIAVPDYSTGAIKWEKIASIKALEPQHVYDLSIEGTRNFIANDIVAHNTYLATDSGKVGIGTTAPATVLDVKGKANFTGNFSIMNASDTIFFVDNTSGRVGIGTESPAAALEIAAEVSSNQLRIGNKNTGATFYYKIGRDFGTGFLDFQGAQAGYTGYDFMSDDGSSLVTIIDNGNVGIGTAAPAYLLTTDAGTDGKSVNLSNTLFVNSSLSHVGINITAPKKALHVIGEFNLSAAGTQREIATNQSCVIIKGPTAELAIC